MHKVYASVGGHIAMVRPIGSNGMLLDPSAAIRYTHTPEKILGYTRTRPAYYIDIIMG